MNISEIIVSQIKSLRVASGMTQMEFGQRFDPPVAQSIVGRWETNTVPKLETLDKIAAIFGVGVWVLCTPPDELRRRECTIEESFVRVMEYTKEKIVEDLQRSGRQPKFDLFNNAATK